MTELVQVCKFIKPDGERCTHPVKDDTDYCHLRVHNDPDKVPIKPQELLFINKYLQHFKLEKAAIEAGYAESSAAVMATLLMKRPYIQWRIKEKMEYYCMSAEEALKRMSDFGRGSIDSFIEVCEVTGRVIFNLHSDEARKNYHLIREIKLNEYNEIETIKLYDAKDAVDKILKIHGKYIDNIRIEDVTPRTWDSEREDPIEYIQKQLNS